MEAFNPLCKDMVLVLLACIASITLSNFPYKLEHFFLLLFLCSILILSPICCSSDSIQRAWKILDQIPGRATGAYSHSQVINFTSIFGLRVLLCSVFALQEEYVPERREYEEGDNPSVCSWWWECMKTCEMTIAIYINQSII